MSQKTKKKKNNVDKIADIKKSQTNNLFVDCYDAEIIVFAYS